MSRKDDFSPKIIETLAKRVGYFCSNPKCNQSTICASLRSSNKFQYTGTGAHITAASPEGARYDPKISSEKRSSIENGIFLCEKCGKLIDKNNGLDYSVYLLHNWKSHAEEESIKRMYQSFSSTIWENIEFDNLEKDYSSALTSISLNEKHVLSCPKNENLISEVKNKLNLAHSCIVTGRSGTGKSILSYQIAYDYFLEGWNIMKLIDDSDLSLINKPLSEGDYILLIIDNAQNLKKQTLEKINKLSSSNIYLLFNWNLSVSPDDSFLKTINSIEINSKEQISILTKFSKSNADNIAEKLNANKKGFHSIYHKIDSASQEETPWKFNYNLSEGWIKAKKDKELLKNDNRKDVILTTISFFQIITLDKGIKKEDLISSLIKYSDDREWSKSINMIINKYCIEENEYIKLPHYKYAELFATKFIPEKDSKVIKFFEELCDNLILDDNYLNGISNFLEYLSFNIRPMSLKLKKNNTLNKLYNKIKQKAELNPPEIKILNSLLGIDKELVKILEKDNKLLKSWFSEINMDNIIEFSWLINMLHNNKYSKDFVSKELLDKIKKGLESEIIVEVYKYTIILDRLSLFLNKTKYKSFKESFKAINFQNIEKLTINSNNLYYFSEIITTLINIDKKVANELLDKKIKDIIKSINEDFLKGYYNIQPLIDKYFGQIIFILYNDKMKNKYNSKQAQELITGLDLIKLSQSIGNMSLRNAENFQRFLLFISRYKPPSMKTIFENLDLNKFQKVFDEDKKISREHLQFISIFIRCKLNSIKFKEYMSSLYKKYDIYPLHLIFWGNPNLCLKKLELEEKNLDLDINFNNFKATLSIIKYLEKEKKRIISKVLKYNSLKIKEQIYSTATNIDNDKDKVNFLHYLIKNHFEIVKNKIVDNTKEDDLIKKIIRLVNGKSNERKTACLYFEILTRDRDKLDSDLMKLKNKYPKSLNYKKIFLHEEIK